MITKAEAATMFRSAIWSLTAFAVACLTSTFLTMLLALGLRMNGGAPLGLQSDETLKQSVEIAFMTWPIMAFFLFGGLTVWFLLPIQFAWKKGLTGIHIHLWPIAALTGIVALIARADPPVLMFVVALAMTTTGLFWLLRRPDRDGQGEAKQPKTAE